MYATNNLTYSKLLSNILYCKATGKIFSSVTMVEANQQKRRCNIFQGQKPITDFYERLDANNKFHTITVKI